MYTIRTTLAVLMLCLALAACNLSGEQGSFSRQNAPEPAALAQHLDNVAREFPLNELKHVATVPVLPEGAGQVIGLITQDQRIESVDEGVLNDLLAPLITRYVNKHRANWDGFEILDYRVLLYKQGRAALATTITRLANPQINTKVYWPLRLLRDKYLTIPKRKEFAYACAQSSQGKCEQNNGVHCILEMDGQGEITDCYCPLVGHNRNDCKIIDIDDPR